MPGSSRKRSISGAPRVSKAACPEPSTRLHPPAGGRSKNIWITWKPLFRPWGDRKIPQPAERIGRNRRIDFAMKSTLDSGLHAAIIMDGNGRWANARGLPRIAGHRAGADAVRRVVETAPSLGISVLTLYAFSADNWRRPSREISALLRLLRHYLTAETARCIANGVRLEVIGRRDRLPK